jgi:hypothetical protein
MGTSATIVFKDEWEDKFFINRGSDGFPDVVLPDLEKLIERKRDSWSGSEMGLLVSSFIALFTDTDDRLPDYMLSHSIRGDDAYQYYVTYNKDTEDWEVSYGSTSTLEKTKELLLQKKPIVCQDCFNEIECIKENVYWCEACQDHKTITIDEGDFDFKINNKYANIVFR